MNKKGSGTVVEMGGLFYARWTVKGERVYGAKGHDKWEDADRERVLGKPDERQTTRKREIPTLQEWCSEMNKGRYGDKLADTTLDTNETIRIKKVDGSKLGKLRLDRIRPVDCQEFADSFKHSAAYVRRIMAYVSKMMSLAEKAGHIRSNPCKGLELPEVVERENRTLSPDETAKLLNPKTRTDAIIIVGLHTGMRRSELRTLQWGDVTPEFIRVQGTKSKASKSVVPCTPEAYAAIKAQPKRGVFVFSTESGLPMSKRNITRDVRKRFNELGIPVETRLHDLRGTFISLLIESGEDIRTVQELGRHADPRTTMKVYARSRQQTKIAAIEKLRFKTGVKPEVKAKVENEV